MTNFTTVTEFLLTGFAEKWETRLLLSLLFLLMYLVTLTGNILIISATTVDQNLHTPMYFFLRNLSILNVCYVSVTVPNACVNYVTNNWAISVAGCATQIFLVIYFAFVEILFLMFMAHDCYVAICQPLHYPVIMNHQFCVQMTLFSLLSGLLYSGAHTVGDVSFIFLTISYFHIFSTILKFPTRERGKAFSTCVPHILVVSVFLSSIAYVYLKPLATSETIQDMILSVFYTIVPPFLNPII
nr:olfactory receptor 14C36-like [Manis javanica]